MARYLVRSAGAESNIVVTVEADYMFVDSGVLIFKRGSTVVHRAGLARLIDIRDVDRP